MYPLITESHVKLQTNSQSNLLYANIATFKFNVKFRKLCLKLDKHYRRYIQFYDLCFANEYVINDPSDGITFFQEISEICHI